MCGRSPLLHMQQARSLGQGVSAGQRSRDACQRQQAPPASTVSLHRSVVTVGSTKSKAGVKVEVMLDLLKIQSKSTRPQWGLVQLLHCWRPHLMQWMSVQSLVFGRLPVWNCQNVWDQNSIRTCSKQSQAQQRSPVTLFLAQEIQSQRHPDTFQPNTERKCRSSWKRC